MNVKLFRKLFTAVCVLVVAGTSSLRGASLTWSGTSTPATNWDVGLTANWKNGVVSSFFNNGDSVLFNDLGNTTTIYLATNVQPAGITVDGATHNYIFSGTNAIYGAGALTKANSGTFTINNSNSFSGGLIIGNGTVTLGNAYGAGSGIITLAGGTLNLGSAIAPGNTLSNIANSTITGASAGGLVGIGKVTGSNTLNIAITVGTGNVFDLRGDMTTFSGTIALGSSANNLRLNGTTGSSLATFDLGTSNVLVNIRNTATAIALGGLVSSNSATTLQGNNSFAGYPATFTIGGNNASTTYPGKIVDGSQSTTAITKVGTGTLTLAGTNTFTGATTVSGGTLTLTNTATLTNSSILTVNSGAILNLSGASPFNDLNIYANKTLKGGGLVNAANVTVAAGGTLSPGDGVGTLTVSNTFSSAGTIVMELNRTNSPATNDTLKASAITITGGTLIITNLGPNLQAGDSFKLFSVAIGGGGFATVSLPASNVLNTVQYVWTNRVAVDGSIQVLSAINTVSLNSTNLTSVVNGSNLELSWPADHLGWHLQAQTNTLAVGLVTNAVNWVTIPGTDAVNHFTNTINPAKGTVFYRMIYP